MDDNLLSLTPEPAPLHVESAVRERYSAASQQVEPALCCPVQYDARYLKVLPAELIERDYGCGDPSRYVQPGETVVDLGAGGGKICYIASQIVGPSGRVWGVDMNDDMLALARNYQGEIAGRIGWDNVHFYRGRIQDLALDLDRVDALLRAAPAQSAADWLEAQRRIAALRASEPMIPSDEVDVVLSNCVLNLVAEEDRRQMFAEIFRVLKAGGRAVISDIVSDEVVPEHLRRDPTLWSGCLSGAFVESEFLRAFERAGFFGVELISRQREPWQTIEGIEFRSVTVRAFKPRAARPMDAGQAVIYHGPWQRVSDEFGVTLERGVVSAVSQATFERLQAAAYAEQLTALAPAREAPPRPFTSGEGRPRDLRALKQAAGGNRLLSLDPPSAGNCCGEEKCC